MANHDENGSSQVQVAVVLVPFLAQGHLNQFLHFSRLVSAYNIPMHFLTTTTHGRQAKLRNCGWDPLSDPNIHFHEFQTPPFQCPSPNPNTSPGFPAHLQPSFDATLQLREPVGRFLRSLSTTVKRLVVIHDPPMTYVVQDTGIIKNAEVFKMQVASAFFRFWTQWEFKGRPFEVDQEMEKDIPTLEGCFTAEFFEFLKFQETGRRLHSGNLYVTSRVIEEKYLDLLQKEEISGTDKHWAVGPFNPVEISQDCKNCHACFNWLDKQDENSVIYISFGTTTSFKDEQIKELARGLEKSEQKFIWVLRDADKGNVFEGEVRRIELPKGYEERLQENGKGMVLRGWVAQLEILGHRATGGFMSHCGWNSSTESISMGVPIAAWPVHSDQPRNAFLITRVLKIGLSVREWERRNELVTSSMVEEAVKKLMDSKEGDEMRKRAADLGVKVRKSMAEGGVSREELNSFISYITRATQQGASVVHEMKRKETKLDECFLTKDMLITVIVSACLFRFLHFCFGPHGLADCRVLLDFLSCK